MQRTERPEYTYDYNWGRIISAGVLLVALGIAITFFLKSEEETTPPSASLSDTSPTSDSANEETPEISITTTDSEPDPVIQRQAESAPEPIVLSETEVKAEEVTQASVQTKPIETKSVEPPQPVIAKSEIKIERTPALSSDTRTKAELFTATIKRAKLTAQVRKREPGANLPQDLALDKNGLSKVYFYTEVIGQAGKTHYHHWYHNGQLKAKVPITIGSDRWRCYSSKYLTHQQTGEWEVKVKNAKGKLLAQSQFNFTDQ